LQDGRSIDKFKFRLRGIRYPIISKDRKTLVFTASAGCYSNLWKFSVEQNTLRPLTDDEFTIKNPRFSNDDGVVLFKSNMNPHGDIFSPEYNEYIICLTGDGLQIDESKKYPRFAGRNVGVRIRNVNY
jgi:Tol biopolymer transport system component